MGQPTRRCAGSRRSCRLCGAAGRTTSTARAAVPASLLQRELVASTGARNLGVVERSDLTGFNWADVPAVLVETGFMSNRGEAALLRSAEYQQKVAGALVAGDSALPDPVDHAAAPVPARRPPFWRLDRQAEWVLEAVRERRRAAGSNVHLDELPAPALAQVLTPLGDDHRSGPESERVRRGMRLEVRNGGVTTAARALQLRCAASSPSSRGQP